MNYLESLPGEEQYANELEHSKDELLNALDGTKELFYEHAAIGENRGLNKQEMHEKAKRLNDAIINYSNILSEHAPEDTELFAALNEFKATSGKLDETLTDLIEHSALAVHEAELWENEIEQFMKTFVALQNIANHNEPLDTNNRTN